MCTVTNAAEDQAVPIRDSPTAFMDPIYSKSLTNNLAACTACSGRLFSVISLWEKNSAQKFQNGSSGSGVMFSGWESLHMGLQDRTNVWYGFMHRYLPIYILGYTSAYIYTTSETYTRFSQNFDMSTRTLLFETIMMKGYIYIYMYLTDTNHIYIYTYVPI